MSNLIRITETDDLNIKQSLMYAMQCIGFDSSRINKEEIEFIINFLKTNFKFFKTENIRAAFELGVKGELDIEMNHYQNFNTMYVSNVLQSYKRWEMKHPPKPEPKPQLPIPEDTPKQAFDFIEKIFNETGKEPLLANWNLAFRHAEETKLIVLTNEEKAMFQENVRFEIEEEMNYKRVRKLNGWIDLREILESKSLMAYECRKRILINYFNGRTNK